MAAKRRLIAIYNVLNEEKTIADSINCILPYVDAVHVYDGAWAQYENTNPSSTDRTAEIVQSLGKKVKWFPNKEVFPTQWDKRTHSLSNLRVGDYFLWLDGDEMTVNPEVLTNLPYGEFDTAWGWCISNLYDEPYLIPRVIRYMNGMNYDGRHWWILDKDKDLIVTHHDTSTRYVNLDTDLRIWNLRQTRVGDKRDEYNAWVTKQFAVENARAEWLKENTIDSSKLVTHEFGYKTKRQPTITIKESDNPKYTLFVGVSRNWVMQAWFDRFNTIEFPEDTELIMVYDSDDQNFGKKLVGRLGKWYDRFNGIKFYQSNLPKVGEFERAKGKGEESPRRKRIMHNWHIALTEAQGSVLLCAEDDTLPDRNDAYLRLIDHLENLPKCGYVQGIEVCRWEVSCLWSFTIEDDENGNPISITSPDRMSGIEEITGGGWYLCAMPMDLARQIPLYSTRVDDNFPASEIGPDITQGWNITKAGYKCYTDHDLKCSHVREDESLHPDKTPNLVVYTRRAERNWGKEFTPIASNMNINDWLKAVLDEREKQPNGADSSDLMLAVLMEEVGEVAKAVLEGADVKSELIQVAAVTLAMYEKAG